MRRVDNRGNARLTALEKDKLQKAFDRMKSYSDFFEEENEGSEDPDRVAEFKDFMNAKRFIEKLKVKNFGKKNSLKEFGAFLESRRDKHFYGYQIPGMFQPESFDLCGDYPTYRVRC